MWILQSWIYNECTCNGRELKEFSDEDIKEYLVGNLCRCTGYMGQFRAVKKYLDYKMGGKK